MSVAVPWGFVQRHCEERIGKLHVQLETAPAESIALIQGSIRELRAILALPVQLDDNNRISD